APLAVEVLAGSHLGHRPYDRHEIALTRHFDPQHTEAILYAVKGDPLNDSGEPFAGLLRLRIVCHAVPRFLVFFHGFSVGRLGIPLILPTSSPSPVLLGRCACWRRQMRIADFAFCSLCLFIEQPPAVSSACARADGALKGAPSRESCPWVVLSAVE